MKSRGNAMTCPHSRAQAVRRIKWKGWSLSAAPAGEHAVAFVAKGQGPGGPAR